MKKNILICLCHTVLMAALCLPAEARMIIGLAPGLSISGSDQHALDRLGDELTGTAGTPVTVRRFDDDAALSNWLLRFQEIDAAIVAPGYLKQQPAGTLLHLVDLHGADSRATPLALVIRSNLDSSQATLIKNTFLKLDSKDSVRKILHQVGLAGITPPGAAIKRQAPVAKLPAVKPREEKPTAPAELQPAPIPEKSVAPPAEQQPQVKGKVTIPAAAETPPKTAMKPEGTPEAAAEPATKPAQPAVQVEEKLPATDQKVTVKEPPAAAAPQAEPRPQEKTSQAKPVANKRLIIFVVLIILLAMLLKIGLLVLRWQKKKKSALASADAPIVLDWHNNKKPSLPDYAAPDLADFETAAVSTPAAKAGRANKEPLVIEAGRLGPGKVPALLKRCADLPEPVVLQVTKGSCEKLVYFAGGQVSGALTQNAKASESGMRWNKLGNLLVREELITSEERDQGLARVVSEPSLRFGEALLKLGLIDLAGLRHALTRQAKVTIYSLILFPEGSYQIFAGDGSLPPEESVSLEVTNLIREASHHQSEWTAIRQALPNLSTALDFSADGRDKLAKVSLSAQQEATLALIDGKRTINDLCLESTMMDYEVYRFLYLMVKAGVLT